MEAKRMHDSDGEFNKWGYCAVTTCRKCHSKDVRVRTWESNDGAYEDYQYRCDKCGATWWVDGIDS